MTQPTRSDLLPRKKTWGVERAEYVGGSGLILAVSGGVAIVIAFLLGTGVDGGSASSNAALVILGGAVSLVLGLGLIGWTRFRTLPSPTDPQVPDPR